jgi:CHAD domain-containing protein
MRHNFNTPPRDAGLAPRGRRIDPTHNLFTLRLLYKSQEEDCWRDRDMAFRLRMDEPVSAGIRRVVDEQITRALEELETLPPHKSIHEARKRCKKIRAALRLARGELDSEGVYRRENHHYRDAARGVSDLRDAEALIECLDRLIENQHASGQREALRSARAALEHRRQRIAREDTDLDAEIRAFADQLRAGRERIADWPLRHSGFDALSDGLKKTYKDGRKALRAAEDAPSDDGLHEWRKRVKDHRYQISLLRPTWKPVMKAWHREAVRLSDLLGEDHDLAVLTDTLSREPETCGSGGNLAGLFEMIARERERLQRAAFLLGWRIYEEKPAAFVGRMACYWDAASKESGPAERDISA